MEEHLLWVKSVLAITPRRWESLGQTIPEELFTRQPAPGEWSAQECLVHCIDTEGVFQTRVAAFMAGKDFPAFDPVSEGSQGGGQVSADGLAKQFGRMREESLALLGKIKGEDLGRRVGHAELGMVSLDEMLHEWAGHDLMHLMQAEQALMQPFIQGCGPWKVYFSDHVIGG